MAYSRLANTPKGEMLALLPMSTLRIQGTVQRRQYLIRKAFF